MQNTISTQVDPLFHTGDASLLEMWDQIQSLQADFAISQELPAYYRSEHWDRAQTVLDLGTGNGHYLDLIANEFPNKRYTGVDKSVEFIQIARERVQRSNIELSVADVLTDLDGLMDSGNGGPWDFVIGRLFFQHMPATDLTKILRILARVTKPGGGAIILDACDSMRLFLPPVPEFMDFFGAYTLDQHDKGIERDVTALLESRIRWLREWSVINTHQICIPSTIPGNFDRFCRSYALMIEIVERVGEIPVQDAAKIAWRRWCQSKSPYTQVGLNILTLQRQSGADS